MCTVHVCMCSNRGWCGADKAAAAEGANGEKKDAAAGKAIPDDGFHFEKEEVLPISYHEVSLLDKILKGSSSAPMGPRPPMNTDGGAVLHLTIYLPTRSEMKIDVKIAPVELFAMRQCANYCGDVKRVAVRRIDGR